MHEAEYDSTCKTLDILDYYPQASKYQEKTTP